ncbi:DUF6491 family protein [Brevundimonas sp.]|uniref:DUF6491 family protein n=1 Tax=Brevundimonas sp. TaxID=1871086 RepID=UPI002D4E4861|nr:DUF6491 family protein [Brevundimonas sp.]HYC69203.1 DUF6491 family protein [Brevundimonas sp.]
MAKPLTCTALASLGLAAVAACAPSPAPGPSSYAAEGGRPCFAASEVHNFRGDDSGPIYVRARVSEVFELATAGCPGFNFANSLNLRPDGASDQFCVGDSGRFMPSGAGTAGVVCAVRVTRKLTPEQVAALPDRLQP